MTEGVDAISIGEDAYAGKPNPHAWMSPVNAQIYVDNMVTALTELDPATPRTSRPTPRAYTAQLQAVQDELVSKPGRRSPRRSGRW